MNRFMQEQWSWIEGSHGMRTQILDILSDADLTFNPGGQNITLGALCRQMGEVEYAYVESLKTFKQDWSYHHSDGELETSVTKLNAWFQQLDTEMKDIISAFSDDDFEKTVDRNGWPMSLKLQLDVYLQALLIFFGKATIYLKMMDKPLPQSLKDYIW